MNYYYKVFVVFEDKKLLKTIIKTNNIGRSIEALLNERKDFRALTIKVVEISQEEAEALLEAKKGAKKDAKQ